MDKVSLKKNTKIKIAFGSLVKKYYRNENIFFKSVKKFFLKKIPIPIISIKN